MPLFFVGHFRICKNGKKWCGFRLIEPQTPAATVQLSKPDGKITFFAVQLTKTKPAVLYHYYLRGKNIRAEKIQIVIHNNQAKIISGNGHTKKIQASVQEALSAEEALKKILSH